MRYRSQALTNTYSRSSSTRTDLKTNATNGNGAWSKVVVTLESLMWDDKTGGSRANKPCTHLTYVADCSNSTFEVYHSDDLTNLPNPRYKYTDVEPGYVILDALRPSSNQAVAGNYIPVSGITSDDLGNCVFNAYNQFINGVRALDASVSIAESGETPRLFQLWQRRLGVPANLVNGFLNYSFGWRPLLNDLRAIARELRSFPKTVRKRLKQAGSGVVVKHYKFNLSSTVVDENSVHSSGNLTATYEWQKYLRTRKSVTKSRIVVVTIRAKVKPKLTGDAQDLLNKLGALGLIPSLATIWKVTRLSFVVDWFYNIGGAIENLQGSLTHDISDVTICVSDTRTREIVVRRESVGGIQAYQIGRVSQKYYNRYSAAIPLLPPVRLPSRPMNYVLLGLLSLTTTSRGKQILRTLDGLPLSKNISSKITAAIDRLSPKTKGAILKSYGAVIPGFRKKVHDAR
jgi:hypothetical protein